MVWAWRIPHVLHNHLILFPWVPEYFMTVHFTECSAPFLVIVLWTMADGGCWFLSQPAQHLLLHRALGGTKGNQFHFWILNCATCFPLLSFCCVTLQCQLHSNNSWPGMCCWVHFGTHFTTRKDKKSCGGHTYVCVSEIILGRGGSHCPGPWFLSARCSEDPLWVPLCSSKAAKTTARPQRNTRMVCVLNLPDYWETWGIVGIVRLVRALLEVERLWKARLYVCLLVCLFLKSIWPFFLLLLFLLGSSTIYQWV